MGSISIGTSSETLGQDQIEVHDCDETLVTAFERVAAKFPSRIAIGSNARELTYRELNESANQLAHQLVFRETRPGDRVAILMSHDAPLIVALLGALKAGAIVLGLDTTDPVSRLQMLMADAETDVIITD